MNELTDQEVAARVDAVLAANRLPVDAEERERLLRAYPFIQQMTASLRLPETRYAEPDLIYRLAEPA